MKTKLPYALLFVGMTMGAIVIHAAGQALGASGKVNAHMVQMVEAGKVQLAVASWWGFDAEDSTDALQAAIDSGVRKLIIDNPGKPWIVRPITLASNQEIVFRKGVEVVAKSGEFKGKTDALFRADDKQNITLNGYGATLRMHRSDYANPPYEDAEWRHTLSIKSCSNVKVYGLTLADSGGDGIYLGTATKGVTNKDIHIKDVTCERHYRQGISVITAENLLIENTIMRETGGTPPQSGIDFEPNHADQRLVNVVMRNCTTEHNKGDGFEVYLMHIDAKSAPVSIRIENCLSIGDNGNAVSLTTRNAPGRAAKGTIEFVRCTFRDTVNSGVSILDVPVDGCTVRFSDCSILDAALTKPDTTPILFRNRADASVPLGGVIFDDCTVRDSIDRALMSYSPKAIGVPVRGVTGTIIMERNGKKQAIEITPELLQEWIPASKKK